MKVRHIQTILHNDCKNFCGGITSLAHTLAKSPNILGNKLNSDCETNHLTFQEGIELMTMTQSVKTLSAIAAEMGYLIISQPDISNGVGNDKNITHSILTIAESFAKLSINTQPALNQQREFTNREKATLKETLQNLASQAVLLQRELDY